ncbi:ArsR family transcriptional regulator [Kitasatospora sp. NPDC101183]|uniref:ArsR/SmtB family transcription factor n=1 Tax=Kitasatospora sp. NPDC101183 TaxID=3364100 RepID=UPI003808648F
MLEISFGMADLARVRFGVSPMDHLLSGVAGPAYHCVRDSIGHERWWRQVMARAPQRAAPLIELVNASPLGPPDFLAPAASVPGTGLGDELDALLAVDDGDFHRAMEFYGDGPRLPRPIAELRDDRDRRLRLLTDAAWALYRACLAPDWRDIRRALRADVAHRAHALAESGTGAMLAGLHPRLAWSDEGRLRWGSPEWNLTHQLDGSGLELRPNLFLHAPTAALAEGRTAVLLYPSRQRPARRADGLAGLIGPARARALLAIAEGPCGTAELAARIDVSPPTASAHATALRNAGAVTTERLGRQVRHSLTPLGRDLLRG